MSSKQKKSADKQAVQKKEYYEVYRTFFSKKSILLFSCGIAIMAVICICYFFITGGTIISFIRGFKNLFVSTEYGVFSLIAQKIKTTMILFNQISLNLPFLLPVLYIALLFDVDRKKTSHKVVYLILSFIISLVYVFGIAKVFLIGNEQAFALSLPFIIFSSVCYVLTERKNKALFYCMWCPGVVGAVVQYFASNTLLTSFFAILVISHIPGTFFVRDLFMEIRDSEKQKVKYIHRKKNKKFAAYCYTVIGITFCLQLLFNGYLYAYNRIPNQEEYTKVTYGPLSQFYLDDDYYDSYVNSLNDLDIIKSRSKKDDPVLITSRMGWMHLYIDRPCAAYSTCLLTIEPDLLDSFYRQNPGRIPKYIYIAFADMYYIADRKTALSNADVLKEMFDCTMEELSMGFLLTVNEYKQMQYSDLRS